MKNMKNGSPKAKVLDLLSNHTTPGATFEVRGTRIKGRFGGDFLAEASIGGNVISRVHDHSWRNAYKTLYLQVSRMFIR